MKKFILSFLFFLLLLISAYVYTETTNIDIGKPWSKPEPWKADPSNPTPGNDVVTVESGNGIPTEVQITVDHDSTGVYVANCGGTSHLSPGSSAICITDNPAHPIIISSDDLNKTAYGTYQLRTP